MAILIALLPVWESWQAPLGRWGGYAFPIVTERGRVLVVDNRRVWGLRLGEWKEVYRLPDEGRAGIAVGRDTLVIGGLSMLYWVTPSEVRSLPVEGAGWIYRIWRLGPYIAIRGVQASFLLKVEKERLTLTAVEGDWLGATPTRLFLRQGEQLWSFPEKKLLATKINPTCEEIAEVEGRLYALLDDGSIYSLSDGRVLAKGARLWMGSYFFTERALRHLGQAATLWEAHEPVYSAAFQAGLIVVLSATQTTIIYLQAPLRWVYVWQQPLTAAYAWRGQWVGWHGQTVYTAEGSYRLPATAIEPAWYQGEWLWATPVGILRQNGRPFAAAGRYINTLAAHPHQDKLAWASGMEVTIRIAGKEFLYRFPQPVRRLGWIGDTLWAWRAMSLYHWYGGQWRLRSLPFQPEEVIFHENKGYFRLGGKWLRFSPPGLWDTILMPPWLIARPLSLGWGRPLYSFYSGDTTFLITSVGLLAIVERQGSLPPLALMAQLRGPALRAEGTHWTLPMERPFVELTWSSDAPFLPTALRAYYQLGEEAPRRLMEPTLLLSLSSPGTVRLRLWIEHPWYPTREEKVWEIRVFPPWYRSWWAMALWIGLAVGLTAGVFWIRSWHLHRLQARLKAERESLLVKTQLQQVQLLQAERMANLGLMAAHIAHEINTPLGVIRSAIEEGLEVLRSSAVDFPLPVEARPSATRMRELRTLWQTAAPDLTPLQIQQLAAVGYHPDQRQDLFPFLNNESAWNQLSRQLNLYLSLARAAEAAQKLYERVQAIRTYVRGIQDSLTTPVSLEESVRATLEFYRPMLRKVEVELIPPREPAYVCAAPARLEQVWANLIQNALQAMPDGGKLTIRIDAQPTQVEVFIQDTGKGIPPHLKERIFEPLFTTKAPGEGTGLGLPLCRQIIESYGGSLQLLHSEPGYTLFGVRLPRCTPSANGS